MFSLGVSVGKPRTTHIPEPGARPAHLQWLRAYECVITSHQTLHISTATTHFHRRVQALYPLQNLCLRGLLPFHPHSETAFCRSPNKSHPGGMWHGVTLCHSLSSTHSGKKHRRQGHIRRSFALKPGAQPTVILHYLKYLYKKEHCQPFSLIGEKKEHCLYVGNQTANVANFPRILDSQLPEASSRL